MEVVPGLEPGSAVYKTSVLPVERDHRIFFGAGRGSRTLMTLLSLVSKTSASAVSAIPAVDQVGLEPTLTS